MEQYFIKFYLHEDGDKQLTLVKVSERRDESKQYPFKVNTYSTYESGYSNTFVTCSCDHYNFQSHYPIREQLIERYNSGKEYCIEIPQSLFNAIETLFFDLYNSFTQAFEQNDKEISEYIDNSESLYGDFFIRKNNDRNTEISFYEYSENDLYTSFRFEFEGNDYKSICRHFANMCYVDTNLIPKNLKKMTKGSIRELNTLFNNKRNTIMETLEYVFNSESDISIQSITDSFWETEERKYRRYLEERDNYNSGDGDEYW